MREQLVFLLQLQQSDVRVRELETAATQLPAKLDPLRRDLAKLQGMLDAERAKVAENETWRKSQQEAVDRERDAMKLAQSKLSSSKNTKEFSAATREVDGRSAPMAGCTPTSWGRTRPETRASRVTCSRCRSTI